MKNPGKWLVAACAIATLAALAGCYGSGKPGGYKGATDPLVAKLEKPELQKALQQRLLTADQQR